VASIGWDALDPMTEQRIKEIPNLFSGPDGSFGETYTDEGGAIVHCHGRIIGDDIDADVTSRSWEYHWHLKKE